MLSAQLVPHARDRITAGPGTGRARAGSFRGRRSTCGAR
jgi:hypothetical protein